MSATAEINLLVLQGPNLNLLGMREPEVYGTQTLADIEAMLAGEATRLGNIHLEQLQSNHEGVLIDHVQAAMTTTQGLMINPGGFTHSSVALRDALAAYPQPIVEVHLSNIYAREEFRRHSLISPVATAVICGLGVEGYRVGLQALMRFVRG